MTVHDQHAAETVISMVSHEAHLSPHWLWTPKWPANLEDQRRAEQIVQELRAVLAPYRDYRVAMEDGYEPFLHDVPLYHYHFLNRWRFFKESLRFNPAEPAALLYRKTADGFELEGVMYTALRWASEEELNARIPLSVAQWHAHVNLCLPSRRQARRVKWKIYGPQGTI